MLRWTAVAVVVALLACDRSDGDGDSASKTKARPGPKPAKVELASVESGDLLDSWTFLGRVEPMQSANLAPAVEGHVRQVLVREGDRVERGARLVVLDAAIVNAELASSRAHEKQLRAELAQARREAERAAKITSRAISEPEKERLATRAETLAAQLEAQKADSQRFGTLVKRHVVRAPFAGVVRTRKVDPGAWAQAGATVIELVSLEEVEVLVEVTAALAPFVKSGQQAKLRGEAPGQEVAAEVVGVVAALDPSTRTMKVRLTPTSKPVWLLAGLGVSVEFPVSLSGRGVTVPRDALVRGPVNVRVMKVADGSTQPVSVEIIATTKTMALVDSKSLKVGDQVVIRGNERLRPGQPIDIPAK